MLVTLAIALENVPEGLAISLVLVPRGAGALRGASWSVFSSLPQVLFAAPAYLFVRSFAALLPAAFGFAAGALVWTAVAELFPEALAETPRRQALLALAASTAAMLSVQALILWG